MQLALENRLNFYQRAGLAMVLTGSVMLFVVLAVLAPKIEVLPTGFEPGRHANYASPQDSCASRARADPLPPEVPVHRGREVEGRPPSPVLPRGRVFEPPRPRVEDLLPIRIRPEGNLRTRHAAPDLRGDLARGRTEPLDVVRAAGDLRARRIVDPDEAVHGILDVEEGDPRILAAVHLVRLALDRALDHERRIRA